MADQDNPFTTCEMLIAIRADSAPETGSSYEWWRALLEENAPFDADGARIQTCARESVAQQTQAALQAGYHPILLFPARAGWTTIVDRLGLMRYQVGMLFRGEDDAAIRYLLSHPSLEVLQARAGLGRLAYPNRAYKQALEEWLRRDSEAQAVMRKLRGREVRLEDFERLGEPDPEPEEDELAEDSDGLRRFEFIWSLDRRYHIRLEYGPEETQRLVQWHEQDRALLTDGIGFDDDILWFTKDLCDLRQRPQVLWAIINKFALPLPEPGKSTVIPLKQPRAESQRRWQIPTSLAAGVVVGFVLAYTLPPTGLQFGPTGDGGGPPAIQDNGATITPRGKPPEPVGVQTPEGRDKLTEQEWLETIADAVLDGEIEQAEEWLRAFKQRYPEYTDSGER